jgi:hypothetical protein
MQRVTRSIGKLPILTETSKASVVCRCRGPGEGERGQPGRVRVLDAKDKANVLFNTSFTQLINNR